MKVNLDELVVDNVDVCVRCVYLRTSHGNMQSEL